MKRLFAHRLFAIAVISGWVLLLLPVLAEAGQPKWIDQLTLFVMAQKEIARAGSFDPYFAQLAQVRRVENIGDHHGTYVAMNRFMDMLEAREGGISSAVAEAIWDFCYRVTPRGYHDVSRHLKANPDYLKEWEAFRRMEERAALAF